MSFFHIRTFVKIAFSCYSRADNLPYEKVGKNEPVCIADEVPFDIPDTWEWVRFTSVISLQSGQDMTPECYNDFLIGFFQLISCIKLSVFEGSHAGVIAENFYKV